jgi:hypothetical protein
MSMVFTLNLLCYAFDSPGMILISIVKIASLFWQCTCIFMCHHHSTHIMFNITFYFQVELHNFQILSLILLIHHGPKKSDRWDRMSKNADLFFSTFRNCAQGVRSQGSDGQPGALPGGFEMTEGEYAEDKAGIVAIGRMAHSPRQRSRTRGIANSSIFDLLEHDNCAPSPLITLPGPRRLFLFPWMKRDLKGRRFGTVEDVIAASTRALNSIQFEEFQRCF